MLSSNSHDQMIIGIWEGVKLTAMIESFLIGAQQGYHPTPSATTIRISLYSNDIVRRML